MNLPTSAKILFISDIHLGGFSNKKNTRIENELIQLLQYAVKNGFQIAILGDLFDYWMEYPNYVPDLGKKLLQEFRISNQTRPSLYITGNHDNWTLGYFSKLGFDVESDYRLLTIGSRKVLLLHGDATGENLDDLKRPLLHRLIRNKMFVKLYQALLPPKVGVEVMRLYSRLTNFLSSSRLNATQLNNWSKEMLQQTDIETIVCGHDHVPRIHKYDFGTYINLGTFHYHKTLAAYNNNRFRLVRWNSDRRTLTPFLSSEISR